MNAKPVYLIWLVCLCHSALAQRVAAVNASISGEQVIINYDLLEPTDGYVFNVQLYSSIDNFRDPLQNVTGDVGKEIKAGLRKQVTWQAKKALGYVDDVVTFEVKATIVYEPLRYVGPSPLVGKIKGKERLNIVWAAGDPDERITLKLLRNGSVVSNLYEGPNRGEFVWRVPKKIQESNQYAFRISGNSQYSNTVTGPQLQIKPRSGVGGWLIGGLVFTAGAIVGADYLTDGGIIGVFGNGDAPDFENSPDDGLLPLPPARPSN